MDPPEFPAGIYTPPASVTEDCRRGAIAALSTLPAQLRKAIEGLNELQLDTRYRNWSIRQIVHHIADSHVNSYIRFKWTLTESTPTIKAYNEGLWSDLHESRSCSVAPSLQLLDGLHKRWCQLLATLTSEQFERAFIHPESQSTITLNSALFHYVWHGNHHTAQILWLRSQHKI